MIIGDWKIFLSYLCLSFLVFVYQAGTETCRRGVAGGEQRNAVDVEKLTRARVSDKSRLSVRHTPAPKRVLKHTRTRRLLWVVTPTAVAAANKNRGGGVFN